MVIDLQILRRPTKKGNINRYLVLTYLLPVLLGVGGLIVAAGYSLQEALVEQAKREMSLRGMMLAQIAHEFQEHKVPFTDPSFHSWLRTSAQDLRGSIAVLDVTSQVVVSSDERAIIPSASDAPELVEARGGKIRAEIRQDEHLHEKRLFVTAPFFGEGEGKDLLKGILRLSVSMAPVQAEIRSTWINLVSAGLVILGLTILASLWLARWIALPIRTLTLATEAIAAGDLDQQVPSAGPDEVQRLAHSFNRMAERVKDLLERQRAFAANAAHELRSPLTGLGLRLDILRRHCQEDPRLVQVYLLQMEHEVAYLQRLVEHLLVFANLDDGQSLPMAALDLAPLFYEAADASEPQAREARLQIRVEVPSHLPSVAANAEGMRIVVQNLLDNAIRNTPAGGEVMLQAKGVDGTVVMTVTDTGQGIAAEHLPHIFERFYRVKSGKSRLGRGAGLGLALVKSLVEAFGGQVAVDSHIGSGTRFTISLPSMGALHP